MSAAPSWPLIFVARFGRALRNAATAAPRVEFFEPVLGAGDSVSGRNVLNLFFRPSKRKTTGGGQEHARPSHPTSSRTAKARNSLLSQRLTGNPASLPTALSCCRPDMGRH